MDPMLAHGIDLHNRGRFFEAHEVLEDAWRLASPDRRFFLQALIHVTVAHHHDRLGNPAGAIRQLRKALRKLAAYLPAYEGVCTAVLYQTATDRLLGLERGLLLGTPVCIKTGSGVAVA